MTMHQGKPVWWPDRRHPSGEINYTLPDDPFDLDPAIIARRRREADRQIYQMANHPARSVRIKAQRSPAEERTAQAALAQARRILEE